MGGWASLGGSWALFWAFFVTYCCRQSREFQEGELLFGADSEFQGEAVEG